MQAFEFVRAKDEPAAHRRHGRIQNGSTGRQRAVSGRRHDADRSDEIERRTADARRRHQPSAVGQDRSASRRRAGKSARRCAIRIWRIMSSSSAIMPFCRRRFYPAPRPNCATWPRRPAIYCNAPAASISATPFMHCNKREPGSGCSAITVPIARWRFWGRANIASPPIPRI